MAQFSQFISSLWVGRPRCPKSQLGMKMLPQFSPPRTPNMKPTPPNSSTMNKHGRSKSLLGENLLLYSIRCQGRQVLQLDRIISTELTVTDELRRECGQQANRLVSQLQDPSSAFPQRTANLSAGVPRGGGLDFLPEAEEGGRSPGSQPLAAILSVFLPRKIPMIPSKRLLEDLGVKESEKCSSLVKRDWLPCRGWGVNGKQSASIQWEILPGHSVL